MSPDSKSPKSFSAALEETGAEGMEILTSEPSRLARATILLLSFLLVSVFIWSFIGRADVIIKANGQLGPESETRHVYVPIGGELVDLYVAEGAPVEKDDLIARINSIAAIEAADFSGRGIQEIPCHQACDGATRRVDQATDRG
jgi:hemolysin D